MNDQDVDLQIEYRLSWEMVDPQQAAWAEGKYGKGIWSRLSEADLAKCTWNKVSRVSDDLADIADQRAVLEMWSATMVQPIRNVVFERRSVRWSDEWESV